MDNFFSQQNAMRGRGPRTNQFVWPPRTGPVPLMDIVLGDVPPIPSRGPTNNRSVWGNSGRPLPTNQLHEYPRTRTVPWGSDRLSNNNYRWVNPELQTTTTNQPTMARTVEEAEPVAGPSRPHQAPPSSFQSRPGPLASASNSGSTTPTAKKRRLDEIYDDPEEELVQVAPVLTFDLDQLYQQSTSRYLSPEDEARAWAQQEYLQIDTTNILFICAGAFEGIEEAIRRRLKENVIVGRLIPAGTGGAIARLRHIATERDKAIQAEAAANAPQPVPQLEGPAAAE